MIIRANLRSGGKRLIAAGIAVVVSVAFAVGVVSILDSFNSSLRSQLVSLYSGADLLVQYTNFDRTDPAAADDAPEKISKVPGVSDVQVIESATLQTSDNQDFLGVLTLPRHADMQLVAGSIPTDNSGIVLPQEIATKRKLQVGDTITLSVPQADSDTPKDVTYTIAAITKMPSQYPIGFVLDPSGLGPIIDHIRVNVSDPAQVETVQDAVAQALAGNEPVRTQDIGYKSAGGYDIYTQDQQVASALQDLTGETTTVASFVGGFVLLSLFVAAMVISNTFQVLVASRTRSLALLRAMGATRGQIRNATLGEGAALGVMGAVVGILIGWGLAVGASLLIQRFTGSAFEIAHLTILSIIIGLAVGVIVTVIATFLPALKATRVTPIAALAPADIPAPQTTIPWIRATVGTILVLLGLVALVFGAVMGQLIIAFPGGLLMAVGVLVLCRVIIPPMVAGGGHLLEWITRSAPVGMVARNVKLAPRRTASTTSAFFIGVTLVTTILVGAQTTRVTTDNELIERNPVDLVVQSPTQQAEDLVAGSTIVEEHVTVPGVSAKTTIAGEERVVPVVAVTADQIRQVSRSTVMVAEPGTVTLKRTEETKDLDGKPMTFTVGSQKITLTARVINATPGDTAVVSPQDLSTLGPSEQTGQEWVRVASNASPGDLQKLSDSVDSTGSSAAATGAFERASIYQVLNILTSVIIGLLAAAIIIAIVGVGNTLTLATMERRRETALVRAMGMTRAGAAFMVTTEAVLMGLVATVLGLVLGTLFGWAGVASLLNSDSRVTVVGIPWLMMLLVALAAPLAAIAASLLPAFAVSRTAPAQAMADY